MIKLCGFGIRILQSGNARCMDMTPILDRLTLVQLGSTWRLEARTNRFDSGDIELLPQNESLLVFRQRKLKGVEKFVIAWSLGSSEVLITQNCLLGGFLPRLGIHRTFVLATVRYSFV